MEYELVAHAFGDDRILAIRKTGRELDVVDRLLKDGKGKAVLRMAVSAALKVRAGGIQFGESARIITPIDRRLFLFELKHRDTAWRVFSYLHPGKVVGVEPVLLSATKGHSGKTQRLRPEIIESARELALAAKELMEAEEQHDSTGSSD